MSGVQVRWEMECSCWKTELELSPASNQIFSKFCIAHSMVIRITNKETQNKLIFLESAMKNDIENKEKKAVYLDIYPLKQLHWLLLLQQKKNFFNLQCYDQIKLITCGDVCHWINRSEPFCLLKFTCRFMSKLCGWHYFCSFLQDCVGSTQVSHLYFWLHSVFLFPNVEKERISFGLLLSNWVTVEITDGWKHYHANSHIYCIFIHYWWQIIAPRQHTVLICLVSFKLM